MLTVKCGCHVGEHDLGLTKKCVGCDEIKPIDHFGLDKTMRLGHKSRCKPCLSKKAVDRYWKDPEKFRKKSLDYAKANPDKVSQRFRNYYSKNRDRLRANTDAWVKENYGKKLANNRKRSVLISENSFFVLPGELRRLYASPCSNCGSLDRIEADHIIPLSRGGRHSIGNLQPLCKACNLSKSGKLQVEWRYEERK